MINNQMQKYQLLEKGSGTDKYGQPSKDYQYVRDIQVAVNLKDYSVKENDPRYVDCTHIGLTLDKNIKIGQKIVFDKKEYLVKYVNAITRLTQLNLKELK